VCGYICVKEAPDHALVVRIALRRHGFEEIDALLAECDRYLHILIAKCQILWRGQKVANNHGLANGLIRILDFRAHKLPFPYASNRLQ